MVLFPFTSASSQVLRGKVVEEGNGNIVQNAVVTVYKPGMNEILTSVSVRNGLFELPTEQLPETVLLTVRALDIVPQAKTIKSNCKSVTFSVRKKSVQLREVVIKPPKIRQSGDTLNYNVSRFMNATDRSIGDVLKKLPGIQVDGSGQIFYQNKPISKFYIEGMDLLKGKYRLATNNVEASKVATVQVLENHQPIKVLKGMEIPDEAAINLKLKSSSLGALFATMQIGGGTQTYRPASVLRHHELVGMHFTSRQQMMSVYKSDNTGHDISSELEDFYDDMNRRKLPDFLSFQTLFPPSIDKQNYLFNNARIISLNDLHLLKKDRTLTSAISYLEDRQTARTYTEQDIFVPHHENVFITELQSQYLVKHQVDGKFVLEKNTPRIYLNNQLKITGEWHTATGSSLTNQTTNYQRLKSPSFVIGNTFRWIKGREHDKRQLEVGIEYTTVQNRLLVMPSAFVLYPSDTTALEQNVHVKRLMTHIYYSGGRQWHRWYAGYKLTFYTNIFRLDSYLDAGRPPVQLMADSLQNHIGRWESGSKIDLFANYEFPSGLRLNLLCPLEYHFVSRNDFGMNENRAKHYVFVSPGLNATYRPNPLSTFSLGMGYKTDVEGFEEDYRGYMMRTYRSLYRNEGIQSRSRSLNTTLMYHYKNPLTTLFIDTYVLYASTWRNTLQAISYEGFISHSERIEAPNRSPLFRTSASVGRSLDLLQSTVSLQAIYQLNQGQALIQGIRSDFKNYSWDVSLHLFSTIGHFVTGDYRSGFHLTKMKMSHVATAPKAILSWTQAAKIAVLIGKHLIATASVNSFFNNKITSTSRFLWFGNGSLQYKLRKADLQVEWNNVFNTKRFITSSYDTTRRYYSEFWLRPSEILLCLRFKL